MDKSEKEKITAKRWKCLIGGGLILINVDLDNIMEFMNEYKRFLGSTFMKEINDYRPNGLKQAEVISLEAKSHPFAKWWFYLKQEVEKSKADGKLMLSQTSTRALCLLSDLKDIETLYNRDRIIKAIKNRSTFYSGCFEACIAASYKNAGYEVKIVPEEPKKGNRTCDLIVINDSGQIYIECKSLNDLSIKTNKNMEELQNRLSKALMKYKRSWGIHILSQGNIESKDLDDIYPPILRNIRDGDISPLEIEKGKYIVSFAILSEWDKQHYGKGLNINTGGDVCCAGVETMYLGNGISRWKNPYILTTSLNPDSDISDRIISEIKKASGQIPKQGPGIIHIELPYHKGPEFLSVVDSSYDAVFKKLNKDSNRINAVVVSSRIIEPGDTPLREHLYVIPNFKTRAELPAEFDILGCSQIKEIDALPDTGNVEFGFTLTKEFEDCKPAYILRHMTNDGRYQIQLWQTWRNLIRLDMVTPKIGRKFTEHKIDVLKLKNKYNISISWDKDLIDFVVSS